MIEGNKATFSRMKKYILFIFIFIFCPSGELIVVLLLCMLSVWTSRCFSCDICEPQIQTCHLNSVRLQGGISQGLSGGEETAKNKQTVYPDCHVPSGSMLKDNSMSWGTSMSQYRIAIQVFCTHFFSDVVPFFCTDPAGRTSANAGSVIEVPLFCDSLVQLNVQ